MVLIKKKTALFTGHVFPKEGATKANTHHLQEVKSISLKWPYSF